MDKKTSLLISVTVLAICAVGYFVLANRDEKLQRPQEPKKPYPYKSEEIVFPSEDQGVQLAGTLTLPSGADKMHPAVVLRNDGLIEVGAFTERNSLSWTCAQ